MLRYSLLLLLFPFFVSSCAEVGCTDPLAENYSPNVVFSGGLCWYTSNLNFWWNEETASALADLNESLGLYMNTHNEYHSFTPLANTFSSSPGCDIGTSSMTIKYDIGEETHLVQYVEVWTAIDSGTKVWSGEIDLVAQGCTSIEITY